MIASVIAFLRWFGPAVVPAVLLAVLVYRTDRRREPPWLVALTFVMGSAFGGVAIFIERKVGGLLDLDIRAAISGQAGSLGYIFLVVAPLREVSKYAAAWPAFRSRHFDEPYDGLVYASAAALGFAALQHALVLHAHPTDHYRLWLMRIAASLPAHLFFACTWGYALGRAKQHKRPGPIARWTFLFAVLAHGFYIHFVYGRGPGALVAVLPFLLAMLVVVWFFARDLHRRGERASRTSMNRLSRFSLDAFDAFSQPPSLETVRDALRRSDEPIKVHWIVFGALVTIGAMIAGLAASIAFGNWARIDFSLVDEHDVSTTAPVALLGSGVLAAFPLSGFLVARATRARTLLEPALATAVAIGATLVTLGLTAPAAVVFALALAPIAWGLACAGAWVGRPG